MWDGGDTTICLPCICYKEILYGNIIWYLSLYEEKEIIKSHHIYRVVVKIDLKRNCNETKMQSE